MIVAMHRVPSFLGVCIALILMTRDQAAWYVIRAVVLACLVVFYLLR